MKVYVTKFALECGILECEVDSINEFGAYMLRTHHMIMIDMHKRENGLLISKPLLTEHIK